MNNFVQVFIFGILSGGIYGLVSVGLTLIFGVLKLVNFAHGEFLMLAMYLSYWSFKFFSIDPYAGAILTVILMFCFGYFIYNILMKPILYEPHVVQIFATLALSMILQNVALLFFKADFRNVRTAYSLSVLNIGWFKLSSPNLVAFVIAVAAAISLYIFLKTTDIGKAMRAISQNDRAARLMGINIDIIYMFTYCIGVALVGLAGVVLVPIYSIYPTVGSSFVNPAFVCVVLGGLGSVPGAVLGGLTIGIVESLTGFYIGAEFQQAAYFIVFLIILIIRPQGFFGEKEEII